MKKSHEIITVLTPHPIRRRLTGAGLVLAAIATTFLGATGRIGPFPQMYADESPPVIYVCPMHPEVTSDKPGRCPKCRMQLEPKPVLHADRPSAAR